MSQRKDRFPPVHPSAFVLSSQHVRRVCWFVVWSGAEDAVKFVQDADDLPGVAFGFEPAAQFGPVEDIRAGSDSSSGPERSLLEFAADGFFAAILPAPQEAAALKAGTTGVADDGVAGSPVDHRTVEVRLARPEPVHGL